MTILPNSVALTFALALASVSAVALAGSEVRGGGNTVRCTPSPDNDFVGLYSLDYVVTYQGEESDASLAPVADVDASLDRIRQILAAKLPKLGGSFAEFQSLLGNHTDYTKQRIWLEGPFTLVDVADQEFIFPPPPNCLAGAPSTTKVIQAVIRMTDPNSPLIRYYADSSQLNELRRERPLQLSFLLVHEWLWDLYGADQINASRLADRLLHDRSLESLSAHDLWLSLVNLGVPRSALGPEPGTTGNPPPAARYKLALGDDFSCLLHDGAVSCWGHDLASSGVAQPPLDGAYDIAAGGRFVCATDKQGLKCWGDRATPPELADVHQGTKLTASGASVCLVDAAGHVHCGGVILNFLTEALPDHPDALAVTNYGVCVLRGGEGRCFGGKAGPVFPAFPGTKSLAVTTTHICLGHARGATCFREAWPKPEILATIEGPEPADVVTGADFVCMRSAAGGITCKALGQASLPWTFLPETGSPTGIAAGDEHVCTVGDGVICWGASRQGQADVPVEFTALPNP